MALGKKGVFFTFIAFIFLGLLVLTLSVGDNYSLRQKSFVIESRVNSMNNFITDLETDIAKAAYITGFRAFVGMEDHIVTQGEYITDVDAAFEELFLNGSLYGANITIVANNTFTDWMTKITAQADLININVNFSFNEITISQDDPWTVKIDLNLDINVTDEQSIGRWDRQKNITTYMDIEGLEDPLYRLGTNGLVDHKFKKSDNTDFTDGSDVTNLLNHTYSGSYLAFPGAPSYLMRLEGDFTGSQYGIESLVDISELTDYGISTEDKSIVDYYYFGPDNPVSYNVNNCPSWFKLDNRSGGNQSHHELYEVLHLT